jgi:hypothetical protein
MPYIAIILSIPKALIRWCGNLKGPLNERGWVKYGESAPFTSREIY